MLFLSIRHDTAGARIDSIDALRGLTVAAMLLVNNPGDWGHVFAPLLHAEWHGCTPTDLIFPFFLFVVGVSIALVTARSGASAVGALANVGEDERGGASAPAPRTRRSLARLWWRGLRLFALGLILNLAVHIAFDTPDMRIMGVLQRIALCAVIVGMLALYTPARVQWAVLGVLLLGYWWLLVAGGSLDPYVNVASRVDAAIFGVFNYRFDPSSGLGHEPEGLVSTLGALATTLLGLRAGALLAAGRLRFLLLLAFACLALGWAWNVWLPFNKNLWTSSYVLWSGGWAALSLWSLHWLIDRWGLPAVGRTFGVNAIAIYAGSALLVCALAFVGWLEPAYRLLYASWLSPLFGDKVASLGFALTHALSWWAVARALFRRRLYFKV